MKKLAVFDIDGTIFRWQLFHEVMIRLADNGNFDPETAENLKAHYYAWQSRSEPYNTFSRASVKVFKDNLKSITPSALREVNEAILDDSGHKVYRYTTALVRELKAKGYFTLALSGSMQDIVMPFAIKYGFDDAIGAVYEEQNGHYSGEISRKVVGAKAKLIKEYAAKNNLTLEDSYAVGDSDGDIDMLSLVANPIAFNPSEELLEIATAEAWKIVVERKNIIYEMSAQNGLYVLEEARSL